MKGVLGLVQWTNPALNGRSPGLDGRVRKGCVDGIWKAFEAVYDSDEDIFDPAIAQIVHHREPELGPFVVGDPFVRKTVPQTVFRPASPQNLALPLRRDAQGHVNRLILDLPAFGVADFDA